MSYATRPMSQYKKSGVNIDAGNESVNRIKNIVKKTFTKNVITGLGSFGAMYDASFLKKYRDPIIVQSIDSVGTKIIIAEMMNKYSSIGEDMVSHACGDILCQGAKPLTFLDYLAFSKVKPSQVEEIVSGMAQACSKVGMSLIGGEVAELPGVYAANEFDIVGSILGVVERDKIVTGDKIQQGDVLLGIASSSLHTNGYSLARYVFFEKGGYDVKSKFSQLNNTLGEELLIPHKNYTPSVLPLVDKKKIKGIAHITGGGFIDNIPRILPADLGAKIKKGSWNILPIFKLIQEIGNIDEAEMYHVFNMGIGLVLVVDQKEVDIVKSELENKGEQVYEIGKVTAGDQGVNII